MSRLSLKQFQLFVPIVFALWFAAPSYVQWHDELRIGNSAAQAGQASFPDLVVSSVSDPPATVNNADLATAAYNAGMGAVAKSGRNIPKIKETQDYVEKIKKCLNGKSPVGCC